MSFLSSLDRVGSALTAERFRTEIITQNIAGANTSRTSDGDPYRRQQVIFYEKPLDFKQQLNMAQRRRSSDGASAGARSSRNRALQGQHSGGVRATNVVKSDRDFKLVYDPTHPQANEEGYVQYSNVDTTEEMVDLMAASNAYEANATVLSVVKAMINRALDMNR